MKLLQTAIDYYKTEQSKNQNAFILILQDPILQSLLATWERLPLVHEISEYENQPPLSIIWRDTNYDKKLWKKISNLTLDSEIIADKIEVLIQNNLIYPDNTIHPIASQFLKTIMIEYLKRFEGKEK